MVDNRRLLEDNLTATKDLTKEVHDLSGRFSAKEILHNRTRRLGYIAIFISLVAIVGLILSGYLIYQNSQNAQVVALNARINCENANDSRAANKKIWTLVVESSKSDPNRTPRDVENSEAFQRYINKLYEPRDCNDLDRRYPIPDPPEFKF